MAPGTLTAQHRGICSSWALEKKQEGRILWHKLRNISTLSSHLSCSKSEGTHKEASPVLEGFIIPGNVSQTPQQ